MSSFGAPQAFLKKRHRALVNIQQQGAHFGFLASAGTGKSRLGQRDAKLLRHQPDGFGEGDVLDFLDEAENIPFAPQPKQ